MRFVVCMTGASGVIYGIRLLQELPGEKVLIMSDTAKAVISAETDYSAEEVEAMADETYGNGDLFAPVASGSHHVDALFVAPCTESSAAKFACGIGDNLISRAVMCSLKERRPTILLTRETPKSVIMLENELKLARAGAVIMDANPGFYQHPETVDDVIDFVVGRAMQQAGLENSLFTPWGSERILQSRLKKDKEGGGIVRPRFSHSRYIAGLPGVATLALPLGSYLSSSSAL